MFTDLKDFFTNSIYVYIYILKDRDKPLRKITLTVVAITVTCMQSCLKLSLLQGKCFEKNENVCSSFKNTHA